jgi:hypothetical protein
MKHTLALLLACALCATAFSQPPAVPAVPAVPTVETAVPAEPEADGPDKIIARFFSYLQRKEVDQAYDQLTRGTKIAERAEDVKTLKSKTKEAITVFGPILGYDSVLKKNGKEFPLRWRFYFYKPQDAWRLIDLRVDDRLAAMFDETEEGRPREPQQ